VQLRPRQVVTAFGLIRCGFGVAFLLAPRRLARGEDLLMTRSFAVRELVLGVGGLRAAPEDAGDWARLGALVDAGDAAAAAAAVSRRVPLGRMALLTALGGLAVEGWAARELHRSPGPARA
jgi:hypothetical protein